MRLPTVAVIGRPNVGKSTLVNRIVGSRKAIVDDLPGVTRDRAYYDAEWLNHSFTLIDTGGLIPGEEILFSQKVNEQVIVALEEADVILFIVDGLTGITVLDEAVVKLLRPIQKPVFLVVNKIDNREQMGHAAEFYSLGLGDPYPVSAMHGTVGVGDLLDKVLKAVQDLDDPNIVTSLQETETLHIAFVGRPNVGKSSLVNCLLGEDRQIVSDTPGTTRDAIDVDFTWEGHPFTLVDTAGIRKKSKVAYGVELFSVDRAIRSLRRADVTVLVIDATEGIKDQDKRIIETSNQAGKGLLIVVNKWDLVAQKSSQTIKEYEKRLYTYVPHAQFAPMIFVSAITGHRVEKILSQALKIQENRKRRIQTSMINQLIHEAMTMSPPPPVKNKRLKIYYGTQVDVAPPTFLLFVNNDTLMKETYRRYIEKRFRESIEYEGTPIVVACRGKGEQEA